MGHVPYGSPKMIWLLQLLNDDQEGCWRTKVLRDFDVMRAEKYKGNKGNQIV